MPGFSHKPSLNLTLALPLALAASTAAHAQTAPSPTATIPVSNCNNSGPGSLRAAVASAANGDTINLRSLKCRQLLLTSGAIQIPQNNLTLLGPTRAFTIDGNQASPVFEHSGSGTLRLRAMSIANGYHEGATGGCIDSDGDLRLEYVRVHGCRLFDAFGFEPGGGGGIVANDIALYDSEVRDSTAVTPNDLDYPRGGGIWAHGHLTLVRSSIIDNTAQGGYGGGFYAEDGVHVRYSEISGNFSRYYGALFARSEEAVEVIGSLIAGNEAFVAGHTGLFGSTVLVINTTVSGNSTDRGGMQVVAAEKSVLNSTIVNNIERMRSGQCNGALSVGGELHLESTIVARNLCGGDPLDLPGDPETRRHRKPPAATTWCRCRCGPCRPTPSPPTRASPRWPTTVDAPAPMHCGRAARRSTWATTTPDCSSTSVGPGSTG